MLTRWPALESEVEDAAIQTKQDRVGEVVEASTAVFTTQCYDLYASPPLGSLVRCGDEGPVYGIVGEVATRSIDPARHPIPRGRDEETEDGVYLSNPQLSRLLLTEFQSVVVGHQDNGRLLRYLAPLPPRIHSFVYRCGGEELRTFSNSLDFLSILLAAPIGGQDDVIASFLRQASASHPEPERFLIDSGKELAVLLGGQLQRLNTVLRRLSP